MTVLEDIRNTELSRLDRVRTLIAETLRSSNPLMDNIIKGYLSHRGKELRPLMAILTARILGGDSRFDITYPAAAIEILHNASLIHDDVVDNSPTRHGAPTINALWDNHIAVLVGDFFVSRSLRLAMRSRDFRVIDSLSGLGATLSEGEMDQLDNAREHTIDERAYFEIITHKTSSLFKACVEVGAYSAGASDRIVDALRRYAVIFGQCFQITDDIFDYFPSEKLGKPTGNDLREGKVTLPLIAALRSGHPRAAEMQAILEREDLTDANIAALIDFAVANGGIEYARDTLRRLSREGSEIVREIAPDISPNPLAALLDFVVSRSY